MNDIKWHLIVMLQSWNFWECGVPLRLPLLSGSLSPGVVIPVRVPFMSQIELFNHLLKIIIISYLKPYSCLKNVCIREEYLIELLMLNNNT